MPEITVFSARRIITMNSYRPTATHVAVKNGRVLGVGSLEQVSGWAENNYRLDEQFADKILMPGFVEGHCHAMEGAVWDYPYVGYQDRYDPDGRLWRGADSLDAVIDVLRQAEQALDDPDQPLFAWGFDPIYFESERMKIKHIDRVSTTRPVLVLHSNGH